MELMESKYMEYYVQRIKFSYLRSTIEDTYMYVHLKFTKLPDISAAWKLKGAEDVFVQCHELYGVDNDSR